MSESHSTRKWTRYSTFKNESGNRYGMLVVIEYASSDKHNSAMWLCKCDCGASAVVSGPRLRNGSTQSCGCKRLIAGVARRKHGQARNGKVTGEYNTWRLMIQRCYRKCQAGYKDYGGRGITVCDRWRTSFQNFFADMGARPVGMSIERKDNNAGYCPENCIWADLSTQARNKRNNRYVTINGVTKLAIDWCAEMGIEYQTFFCRVRRGMTDVEAITTPNRNNTRKAMRE